LHSTKWRNGKKKKGWKSHSPQNKFNRGFGGNEENGYPVPDLNKTLINFTNEPSDIHKKKSLKEEITQKIM
jgi:hypothetical protein